MVWEEIEKKKERGEIKRRIWMWISGWGKGENPFMRMRSVCITYAVCKCVTFSTVNALKVLAALQQWRQVNLII